MLYTITNSRGMQAAVTNIGAALVRLIVPDRNGKLDDVVLGFDRGEDYLGNGSFFGVVVGPNANRIAGASFALDGVTYQLDVNDGPNNLHSHKEKGYHKRLWEVETGDNSVKFTLEDPAGSMGFPGNKTITVTYFLDEENGLTLLYDGWSDCRTVMNLTNHTYFNLEGHNSGTMLDHELCLNASRYTPVVAGAIPTGRIEPTAGTPMDFTKSKKIGRDIDADFEQLRLCGGFDHNWVIDGWDGSLRQFATVKAPKSGRIMKAFTTLPGVQFYAGNFIDRQQGKENAVYEARMGLCLETQFFPDSVHNLQFPNCIFGGLSQYESVTLYKFEI